MSAFSPRLLAFLFSLLSLTARAAEPCSDIFSLETLEPQVAAIELRVARDPPSSLRTRAEQVWWLRENGQPERASALEAQIVSNLQQGKIKKIKRLKANSEAYIILFENGEKAIFKPKQQRNDPRYETFAWHVDRLLGFNRVPITVSRAIKTGWFGGPVEGSLQFFFDHADGNAKATRGIETFSRTGVEITLFDYLIANDDRGGNILGIPDRFLLVDNGDIHDKLFTQMDSVAREFAARAPEALRQQLLSIDPAAFREACLTLGDEVEIDAAVKRFESLQEFFRQ